jgi:hypothetical protein
MEFVLVSVQHLLYQGKSQIWTSGTLVAEVSGDDGCGKYRRRTRGTDEGCPTGKRCPAGEWIPYSCKVSNAIIGSGEYSEGSLQETVSGTNPHHRIHSIRVVLLSESSVYFRRRGDQ